MHAMILICVALILLGAVTARPYGYIAVLLAVVALITLITGHGELRIGW